MSRISPEPYFQNLVSEHSIEGVPASLYTLTKSVPDPLFCEIFIHQRPLLDWIGNLPTDQLSP